MKCVFSPLSLDPSRDHPKTSELPPSIVTVPQTFTGESEVNMKMFKFRNVPNVHSLLRGFCPKPLGVYLEPDPIALNYDIYAAHPSDQSLVEGFPISTAIKSQALESPSFTIRYFDSAKTMLGIKRSPENGSLDESDWPNDQPNPPVTLAYCLSLETNSRSKPTGTFWDKGFKTISFFTSLDKLSIEPRA